MLSVGGITGNSGSAGISSVFSCMIDRAPTTTVQSIKHHPPKVERKRTKGPAAGAACQEASERVTQKYSKTIGRASHRLTILLHHIYHLASRTGNFTRFVHT